jgi:hypothetical protein
MRWAAAVLAASVAAGAAAETTVTGQGQITPPSVKGAVTGTALTVDAKFAATHKIAVQAPFSTLVPVSKTFQTLVVNAPKPGEAFAKVNFAALDGKTLLENIQFIPLQVPMGPLAQRLQQMATILSTTGVERTTAGKANPTVKMVRQIKSGPYDAVEVIGTYDSAANGLMYYRMVGILNPKSKDCVMTLSNVVGAKVKIVSADDFAMTRSGSATQFLKYLGP